MHVNRGEPVDFRTASACDRCRVLLAHPCGHVMLPNVHSHACAPGPRHSSCKECRGAGIQLDGQLWHPSQHGKPLHALGRRCVTARCSTSVSALISVHAQYHDVQHILCGILLNGVPLKRLVQHSATDPCACLPDETITGARTRTYCNASSKHHSAHASVYAYKRGCMAALGSVHAAPPAANALRAISQPQPVRPAWPHAICVRGCPSTAFLSLFLQWGHFLLMARPSVL